MSTIELLPVELANQIAAGEVIERPVSVVKELVENSIDAGADRIAIELIDGGKEKIKVSDNGLGIAEQDLPKTILKHATSKLHTKEDLFKIATLGFRGEALAAIAAVSDFKITSNDGQTSLQMQVDSKGATTIVAQGHPQGTTIEIGNLFAKIPARLKFLKSGNTEYLKVLDYLKKLTLSAPQISFTLIHNGKETLRTQGIKDNPGLALKNSLGNIYGKLLLPELLDFSLTRSDYHGWGMISRPTYTRADRSAVHIFVNNRLISSPLITKAIDEALRDILPVGRHPYLCCFLQVPYDQVDINVHPQKKEVRFADNGQVFSFVNTLIRSAFLAKTSFDNHPIVKPLAEVTATFTPSQNKPVYQQLIPPQAIVSSQPTAPEPITEIVDHSAGIVVLGQANKSWIAALDGDDLIIIDQHAAHERINYENLKKNCQSNQSAQGLLFPLQIELDHTQKETLSRVSDQLKSLGFDYDLLENNLLILRGVPQNLKKDLDFREIFLDLLTELQNHPTVRESLKAGDDLLKMAACKASVKAGESLTYIEMKQLVKDLFATDNYLSCPHGRPTITALTDQELRKRFHRT